MSRRTVVFDLDGTLVAGDSFGAFLRHLLARSPLRLGTALATAPAWGTAMTVPGVRPLAERYLVWLAVAGMHDAAFSVAARDFAGAHAGPRAGRTAAAAVARVREHVEAGDRVIVATGCAAPLAHEVCRVIGLPDVEVVATVITRRRWGLPARGVPTRGEGKVRALVAAGVRLPVDEAYSDSFSDLPLLRNARVAHVVDPAPRDLRRLRAALGADVEVLRWSSGAT